MITPQQLYLQSKHKTRVVIYGSQRKLIIALILHVLEYHERNVDYLLGTEPTKYLNNGNEFIVIETAENAHELKANIALLSSSNTKNNAQVIAFIKSLTNGGILVYNAEDISVEQMVKDSSNPIKKYPYHTPEYSIENDIMFLDTREGKLPLELSGQEDLQNIAGSKWICQHMGIDEDDFYEAIGSFSILS